MHGHQAYNGFVRVQGLVKPGKMKNPEANPAKTAAAARGISILRDFIVEAHSQAGRIFSTRLALHVRANNRRRKPAGIETANPHSGEEEKANNTA